MGLPNLLPTYREESHLAFLDLNFHTWEVGASKGICKVTCMLPMMGPDTWKILSFSESQHSHLKWASCLSS